MSTPANADVYAWRWFQDSGSTNVNSPGAALAALNSSYELPYADRGKALWLYIGIENDGEMAETGQFSLEYNTDSEGRVPVTTTSADIQVIASANETDAAVVTTPGQLGAGAGSWTDGEFDEGDGATDANVAAASYTNHVYSIQCTTALTGGESIDLFLRIAGADATNDSGATINITIGAAPAGQPPPSYLPRDVLIRRSH